VLLGTPNQGTYATVPLLAGSDKVVRWLAKLDLKNSLPEVLRILNTFPASYQLLPAPTPLPSELQTLYHAGTWRNEAIEPALLEQGRLFQEQLARAEPLDPARTACILGCNHRTLSRLEIVAPGEFRYFETLAGDGRVPHALAGLPGVPAYFVEEDHGNLATNALVLKAVNELLTFGHTLVLPTHAVITRAPLAPDSPWHRPIGDDLVATALEKLARRHQEVTQAAAAPAPAQLLDQASMEQTLLRAALGDDQPARSLNRPPTGTTGPGQLHKLLLRLEAQPIARVMAPVLVMGHYQGAPLTTRLREMDKALNYWISEAQDHAMVSGELGHISIVPAPALGGQAGVQALLLAGMGEEGRFTHHDLHYLFTNVTRTLLMLGCAEVASVLVGTRAGTMSEKQVLLSMLEGLAEVLNTATGTALARSRQLTTLVLVARSYDNGLQYHRLTKLLPELVREQPVTGLCLSYEPCPPPETVLPDVTEADITEADDENRPRDLPPIQAGPRITIERTDNQFRFSALVDGAVIPVREVKAQPFFPSSLSSRLMESVTREEQETYGQLLTTALFPLDFQEHLNEPLTFILDRDTAGLPWEMACFAHRQRRELQYFGPQLQLTRQFRSMLTPRPGQPPQRNDGLRVLVVADPAPEPELQLPGARREGRAVVQILSHLKQHWALNLDVVERIGDTDCDPLEILGLILDGNFDVVHFAGHGTFDATHPDHGGWVFGKKIFLSAREIFQARRVPRLVFANACFSAQVTARHRHSAAEELNRNLAGIAEAFFERGVRNYLGTGWPVNDALAELFAQEFYAQALVGLSVKEVCQPANYGRREVEPPPTLSRAIAHARALIAHRGSTWGAYQHYGQANDLLLAL
jgi:hypothetical protein